MERLSRFDVAVHGGVAMVVIESELLPPDPAIVVILLLRDYPAMRYLDPILIGGDTCDGVSARRSGGSTSFPRSAK